MEYTTHQSKSIKGAEGDPSCIHKWVKTYREIEELNVKTITKSFQCIDCGKQYAEIGIWEKVIEEEEEDME